MKKKINLIAMAIFIFGIVSKSYAQDTLQIKIGFLLAPQAVVNLRAPEKGATTVTSLLATTSFIKGKNILHVIYSTPSNSAQLVYYNQIFRESGAYIVGSKKIQNNGGYAGIGVTRYVAKKTASAFFEFGTLWDEWTPQIYAGVIIPFNFRIK
ncbi:MAG: hypothetical protein WC089_03525 [Candidatus Paceibacterota bacterium]